MYGEQRRSAVGFVCALLVATLAPARAMAFEVKHTPGGLPVKWTSSSVSYVIDPSVAANVPGGAGAIAAAAAAWSGMVGAPSLSTTAGPVGGVVAPDGQNTVLLAPDGFAPAGKALAITIVTYEESTGAILDADIVVNGEHSFAVLASGARAADGVKPVSNEASSEDGEGKGGDGGPRFDIEHVAAHELGHSLGLGDVRDQVGEVMYAFTLPGDSSYRAPAPDDVDGIAEIYGGSPPAHAGCGASVAGGPARPEDAWAALALALAGAWAVSRRRARALAPVWPACAVIAVLAGDADAARSATRVVPAAADAVGTVAAASTRNVDGVFQTTLDVVPTSCRARSCPATARVVAWGGTLGGITQQVGERPVPRVGDRVALAFVGSGVAGRETDSRAVFLPEEVSGQP